MNLKEISSGITHIEDLKTEDFLKVVSNLAEYGVTEKVDGSQILFGIDEKGFYTSRESKGGGRVYSVEDYEIQFSTTYRRAAHKLLEAVLPKLREAGLKSGDQVEAEVLYGSLPNVVPYSESSNYLIFLRTTDGTANINHLKQKLNDLSLSIPISIPITENGKDIKIINTADKWEISRVPELPVEFLRVQRIVERKLKDLRKYLSETQFYVSNLELESTPLNKIPSWCPREDWETIKFQLKTERDLVRERIQGFKLGIKEILLDHYVRPFGSIFSDSENPWIEGVVLKHRTTDSTVKIIDKKTFGVIREFIWDVRSNLTDRAKGINDKYSFLGEVYVGLATIMGHPELGTMQCKKYYRQAIFEDSIPVDKIKESMLTFLELKSNDLDNRLDKYEKEKHKFVLEVNEGTFKHKVGYAEGTVDRRTKESFATVFEQISVLTEEISRSQNLDDIIKAIAGRHLT